MKEAIAENITSEEHVRIYRTDLKEAVRIVLSDRLPDFPVDALFFHGRARGDDEDIFGLAAQLVLQGKVGNIVITDTDGQGFSPNSVENYQNGQRQHTAWTGKAEWARRLDGLGVDVGKQVWFSGPAFHTNQENDEYLLLSKRQGWKTAATLTHPHQLTRAIMGQIVSMEKFNYHMDVYCVYPHPTDWEGKVYGSQGLENKPRSAHILDELNRIAIYGAKGDMVTSRQLFKYYENRPGVNLTDVMRNYQNRSSDPKFLLNIELIQQAVEAIASEKILPNL